MDQDCDTTPLSCELRRIADQLSQPDWLDILSGLVLPALVALATLAVALYATGIAKQNNKLTEQLEVARVARDARANRLALVPDLDKWVTWQVLFGPGEQEILKGTSGQEMRAHQQRLGDPSLAELQKWVLARVTRHHAIADKEVREADTGNVFQECMAVVTEWANDPQTLERRQQAALVKDAIDRALESHARSAKEQEEVISRLIGNLSAMFPSSEDLRTRFSGDSGSAETRS
jgi:hypothetical protein